MNKKLAMIPALVLALGIASVGATKASAMSLSGIFGFGGNGGGANVSATANTSGTPPQDGAHGSMRGGHGVFGTVTAINGDTITIQSKGFGSNATTTTYTVNATGATVMKADATSSLSAITVGDTIVVQGTVSGTSVTATKINDGVVPGTMRHAPGSNGGATMPGQIPQGNGQPIIGGKVTAVNGDTITITNSSNASYAIDATSAKVTKGGATSTVSSVAVGDEVLAQGTINGNSVIAVSLTDTTSASSSTQPKGILGSIGSFFSHLFGF